MKINEFGSPENLEEGVLSSMLGATPVAAVSGLLSRKGTKQTLTQNAFIKDFVDDAITSISNGISGKFIDPKKTMAGNTPPPPAPPAPPASPKPTAAVPTTSPTQVPPAQQTGQTMSPQQTATAKMQTKAGIQPTGQKMTAAQRTQAQLQARKMQAAQKPRPVKEATSYDRLNSIFENILEATDPNAAAPDSGKPSIGDYMYDWFNQYMSGVNWISKKDQVIPYLEKIEKDYNSVTKAKGAITQLAQVAYALSKAYGTAPIGAQNAKPPPPAPAATDDIDTKIADLAKDPKAATAMKNWAAKNA
jgi:hypothetical protein